MSKFNNNKVMPRFLVIAVILTFIGMAVIGKALYIMTAKKDYWTEVASRLKRDSVNTYPNRGNILSCNGKLMASSIPEFKIFMDFKVGGKEKDSMWCANIDLICDGLHKIFPEKSAGDFKRHLEKGRKKMSQNWPVWPYLIDYNTYTKVKQLPVFCLSPYKGGFHCEEKKNARRRPFGSLAQRTIGDMFNSKDTARCGLELSYDSILRGSTGIKHRRKVLNKYMDIPVTPPVDGADIVTSIDMNMQDIAERAVIDELKLIDGNVGVAILMEVHTGDIKAIVNITRCSNGEYREIRNNAVSDLLEPGSVFKTASLMVALDDGIVDTTYKVDTGCGIWKMHGRDMKDHNWRRGGYQVISVPRILEVSSNIGVSRIIDENYGNNPEKFIEGIYRTGLASDLNLPFVGAAKPRIRMPKKNKHGQYTNWSKTALPWMSIGYETQIPPISTLTFYNAIANNGKMVRPRFVKKIVKDGETVMEFPTEVIKESICKKKTLDYIQTILEHVVSQGLGSKAGSKSFKVAGKTGTAQISKGAGGYKSGVTNYLLSFAGYFPADAPRYSCIVCIQKSGLPASGGGMSGVVFHNIAEGVMAQNLKLSAEEAHDTSSILIPDVKNGNIMSADYVLTNLGIKTDTEWKGNYAYGNPIWGKAALNTGNVTLTRTRNHGNTIPDVTGMGARDAVYMLESRGLKVCLKGRGKVKEQSCAAGKTAIKGQLCTIILE
ncbi:penicillin-binding protein [Xylanibacter muris]|uniref:Transpeptidase family protein n=1 Tax=Xylanibacter muris TaxID=2736290 RepID=A0ABX2AN07_9BACT|nr:penicillin-binding protein [Xylanibacter muris]NPD92584.1 transpeptidase family protein [Xylanibacter muris]